MFRYKRKKVAYMVLLAALLLAVLLPNHFDSAQAAVPVKAVKAVKIAAGDNFTMVLKSDGSVIAWGYDVYGQTSIAQVASSGVVDIAAGADHALILLSNGTVSGRGANASGQAVPPVVEARNVVAIAAGEEHSLALRTDGSVIGWGSNSSGQTNIPLEAQSGVSAIAAGREHSLALKDGKVIAWGRATEDATTVPNEALSDVASLSNTNWYSSAAIGSSGRMILWGSAQPDLAVIPPEAQSGVTAISLGSSHALAVKDGGVIAWGSNSSGQTSVPPEAKSGVISVAAGSAHSVALKADGTVIAWGNNLHDQSHVPGSADLNSLTISPGWTTADFEANNRNYTHYVNADTQEVNVTAALASHEYGMLLIDGEQQASGTARKVPFAGGSTTIAVRSEPYMLPGSTYSVTVLRDATPPTIILGTNGNENWAVAASTTVTVSDAASGIASDSLQYAWSQSEQTPGSGWTSFSSDDTLSLDEVDGDWYLHIRAQDRAGNSASVASNRFRLDQTPPTIEVTMNKANGSAYINDTWSNQHVTVNAVAIDDSVISSFSYSRDNGATWSNYTSGTNMTLTDEGVHTFIFRAVNTVGLSSQATHIVKINTNGLMLTPRLLHQDNSVYTSGAWTNKSVTVSVYAEAGVSGIDSLTYSLNGQPAQPYSNEMPIVFDQEGEHTVFFEVADRAGNRLDQELNVNLDESAPSIRFGTDGSEAWAAEASTTVTVSDDRSGVEDAALFYAWTTSNVAPDDGWTLFGNGDQLALEDTDGEWYLHIRALDRAGNGANAVTQRFMMDASTAKLSGLSLSSGSLQPAFDADVTAYRAQVAHNVTSITVTPTSSRATDAVNISINNGPALAVHRGQPSEPLALRIGDNTIAVHVTSRNGAHNEYIVTATRGTSTNGEGGASPPSTIYLPSNGYLVGPGGRSISFQGGHLVIPKHALNSSFYLNINSTKNIDEGLLQDQAQLVSRVVRLVGDRKAEPLKPITISLSLDNRTIDQERYHLGLFELNEETSAWTEIDNVTVNWDEGIISGTLDRFATIAAIARPIEPEEEQQNEQTHLRLTDIAGHWAETVIKQAVDAGIVTGHPDGTFQPNRPVTRAEFVVMLMRALQWQGEEEEKLTFADWSQVPTWARQPLAQASRAGIVKGYPDGKINPTAEINRAEMTVMVASAMGLPQETSEATGFEDDQNIPVWAKPAIAYMQQSDMVQGKGANRFMAYDRATRAEAVALLLKMLTLHGQ